MDTILLADLPLEIWINTTARIASMHEVQEYRHVTFGSKKEWLQFVDELIHAAYHFQ